MVKPAVAQRRRSGIMSDVAPTADPDERVRIDLLGGFRVVVGNWEVRGDAWPGRRAAELVQLLALAANRRLQRDQVIEALWPHLDPAGRGGEPAQGGAPGSPGPRPGGRRRPRRRPGRPAPLRRGRRRATFCRLAKAALRSAGPRRGRGGRGGVHRGAAARRSVRGVDAEPTASGCDALHVEVLRLAGLWRRLVGGRARRRAGPPGADARSAARGQPPRRHPVVRAAADEPGTRARPRARPPQPRAVRGVRRGAGPGRHAVRGTSGRAGPRRPRAAQGGVRQRSSSVDRPASASPRCAASSPRWPPSLGDSW